MNCINDIDGKEDVFYKASPLLFARAKELRNNVTKAEMVLWGI